MRRRPLVSGQRTNAELLDEQYFVPSRVMKHHRHGIAPLQQLPFAGDRAAVEALVLRPEFIQAEKTLMQQLPVQQPVTHSIPPSSHAASVSQMVPGVPSTWCL